MHFVNPLRTGVIATAIVASVLLYVVAAWFAGTVLGLLAAILGALLIVLAAAVSIGSHFQSRPSRIAGFTAGIVTAVLGLVAAWWGTGQCGLLIYDPWCTVKFYGAINGGISAAVGAIVWIAYFAVKNRA